MDSIGETIVKIVQIKHEVDMLTERIHGASHPQSIDEYATLLREKNTLLAELKYELKGLRIRELEHYQERLLNTEREIEISTELMDEHDLRELKKEIEIKIETIQKAIVNEN
jgi:hypothetical protein